MGPAKKQKTNEAQLVKDDPKEMKAAISRMLGFLKYRSDATKNKKKTELAEAQQVLEALGSHALFTVLAFVYVRCFFYVPGIEIQRA